MYKLNNGVYFGRLPNGNVRLLVLPDDRAEFPAVDGDYPDARLDLVIDDGHWGSVVAGVSAKGEADGRWYRAMDFHHGRM